MISRVTWPNYRGGGDRDAVEALLKDQGMISDATFGKTKVFIQSPETIFSLEGRREAKIPEVVTFIQKIYRGILARRRVAKMRAALKIGLYYRHYLLRTYVNELVRIFGSVNRRSDLGKSLSWPPAPKPMAQVGPMLRGAHARWRAWKILSKYPRESWPEMNLKIKAMEALSRSGRSHWGIDRKWAGNYMNISSENLDTEGYRTALSKEGVAPTKVVFSAKVNKFNRHGKVNERALVVSDKQILKMDPLKKFKVMESMSLGDVRSVSISPDAGNQLLVVHFTPSSGHNDLVMSLTSAKAGQDLVGEAVAVLVDRLDRLKNGSSSLNVTANNVLQFMSNKKAQSITVHAHASAENNNSGTAASSGACQFIRSKGGGVVYTDLNSLHS